MVERIPLAQIEHLTISAPVAVDEDAKWVLTAVKEYLAFPTKANADTLQHTAEMYQAAWIRNSYLEQEEKQ